MIDSLSTSDGILALLTQVEELLEQGRTVSEACCRLQIPVATYHIWRRAHSRTFLATARKLEALEGAHARMLTVLTEQQLEIQSLERQLASLTLGRVAG